MSVHWDMGPDLLLGVDGGNSKTIALVATADGTVQGAGRAGCSDIYSAPCTDAPIRELQSAIMAALDAARLAIDRVGAATLSMAGADWPDDHRYLMEAARGMGLRHTVTVVNDALGALRAGSPSGLGVAVVVGTGAATGARGPGGAWHHGWWQAPQGSRQLADQALRAVYRAGLGIAPPTALTAEILTIYGASTAEAVLYTRTKRTGRGPDLSGQVTRALLTVADAGDGTARRLVADHGRALGEYALAAARQVGFDPHDRVPLVLAGGVFRHPGRLLARALVERVHRDLPLACPIRPRLEPVAGAVLLAFDAAGLMPDGAIRSRLAATLPPDSLYAT